MADYQCRPLWEASPGIVGNINPSNLPITHELVCRLNEWAKVYDGTLNMDDPLASGFKNSSERTQFLVEGAKLKILLAKELGLDFYVTSYFFKYKILDKQNLG